MKMTSDDAILRDYGWRNPNVISESVQLKPGQYYNVIELPAAAGTITITLPPRTDEDAIDARYQFRVTKDNGSGVAVVTDGVYTSANLTALNDYLVVENLWAKGYHEVAELTT